MRAPKTILSGSKYTYRAARDVSIRFDNSVCEELHDWSPWYRISAEDHHWTGIDVTTVGQGPSLNRRQRQRWPVPVSGSRLFFHDSVTAVFYDGGDFFFES